VSPCFQGPTLGGLPAPKLTVTVDSEPPDGKVVTCVMYNHAPVKTMKFNDLLSVTVAQSDKDDTCPCK